MHVIFTPTKSPSIWTGLYFGLVTSSEEVVDFFLRNQIKVELIESMAGGPERGCGATQSLRTNRVMVEALNKVTQRKKKIKREWKKREKN